MKIWMPLSGIVCCFAFITGVVGQSNKLTVSNSFLQNAFPAVYNNKAASIYIDSKDASVVTIAGEAFQKDVALVTDVKPALYFDKKVSDQSAIIIGTIGQSQLIDQLIQSGKLKVDDITGKRESFIIATVKDAFGAGSQALVIAGSDRRGTAFGVFEVSKLIGVSPWYWWADVTPGKKKSLFISQGIQVNGPPSVEYRGIFLNDEDWGLQPWAAKQMDPAIHDIGPNTYAHIFELLLRLKANYIWPAMHSCTKAFYYYKENAIVADKYAIVVGTSHCEPMLRNNLFEWSVNFKNEYNTAPKEWRYDVNKTQILPYWEDRIKQVKNYESVITVGMRGIHDGSMPGPKDINEKVKLLENIITDQRNVLQNTYGKRLSDIPQIFCPYKEVLQLYRAGLKLPDDVTIAWADDNFGYITQLPNKAEQQRAGGGGVYYHLSYWGAPQDYLWLSTNSPSLVSYELTKAYDFNAKRLWVINVGDLKPAEEELNFAMDLAYNVNAWRPDNAGDYTEYWAAQIFGNELGKPIAAIKNEYYRLAQEGKPEHLNKVNYSNADANKRLRDYQAIAMQAEALYKKVPQRLKDAFFELILYPVKGACLMNEKVLYARLSIQLAKQGKDEALQLSSKALTAYKEIDKITDIYNNVTAKGKWAGMMSWHPRDLDVFKMPEYADEAMVQKYKTQSESSYADTLPVSVIQAQNFVSKTDAADKQISTVKGLGIDGQGVTVFPFTALPTDSANISKAPYVTYKTQLTKGMHNITVKCLPTHSINQDYKVRYAIAVNDDQPQIINLNSDSDNKAWAKNVVYGYASGTTKHNIDTTGESTIKIYILEPAVVVNRIEVW